MRQQIKKKQITITLVALACISICAGTAYQLNYLYLREKEQTYGSYPSFVSDPNGSAQYEIDPETILLSLDQDGTEIFHPVSTIPEDDLHLNPGSFPWMQSDYLKIANALVQTKLSEGLNDWEVLGMYFKKECSDTHKGFDAGSVIYFKINSGNNRVSDYLHYQTITVEVYPLFKKAVYDEAHFPRPLFGWTGINMSNLKITADDALQIVEELGGKEARLKVNNVCNISILNSPLFPRNWRVSYDTALFDVSVDLYSGKAKVIE